MKRPGKRDLLRALRTAAPDPPADLRSKLSRAIPEDLFGPRAEEGGSQPDVAAASTARRETALSSGRGTRGRALAMAASLLAVIGSGYLAMRLYEDRGGTPDEALLAERTNAGAPAPPRENVGDPAAPLEDAEPPLGAIDAQRRHAAAEGVPPLTAPEPGPGDGDSREIGARRDAAPAAPAGAALDALSSDRPAPDETEELAAESTGGERRAVGSLAERKARLESDADRWRAASFRDVPTEAVSAAVAHHGAEVDRRDEPSSFADASTRPVSTLTVEASEALLLQTANAPRTGAALDVAPLANLLDDVARSQVAAGGPIVAVETAAGPPSARPARVFVFVSAMVVEHGRGRSAGAPDTLELELDPVVSPRYRLLDSEARLVGADARPTAGARSRTRPEAHADAAPLFRLSALFEIEHLDGAGAEAQRLGVIRLRGGPLEPADSRPVRSTLDRVTPAGGDRVLDVWAPVRSWESTRHELRLAVLAAQLVDLGRDPGGSVDEIAAIQGEIARAEREATAGSSTADSAARLRALADALAAPPPAPAQPAAPTAARPRGDR